MAKKYAYLLYFSLVALLRGFFIFLLYSLKVYVPYMVSKNVFDVYEYIELFRSSRYRPYMRHRPFFYYVIMRLKLFFPGLSVKFTMTVFIFFFDLLAGLLLFRLLKHLLKLYKEQDEENVKIFATTSVKHSKKLALVLFTFYVLNPVSVFYNYATNPDGYKYFLLILSVYSSVFSKNSRFAKHEENKDEKSNELKKKKKTLSNFRFNSYLCDLIFVSLVLNTSHVFLTLLFPIVYLRSYHKVNLTESSVEKKEFLAILKRFLISTTLVLVVLQVMRFNFLPNLDNPHRVVDSSPSIDYSFGWYLNQLLPVEFVKGTLFKNHFMGFVFVLPLLVGLRRYPFDYFLIMTCICVMTQPEMSMLGITFVLMLLVVNYQVLQRTQPFSKLVHGVLALLVISVFAYASWVGRYMANPNYFFGPQIAILIIFCIILEDYTKVVYFKHVFKARSGLGK